MAYHYLWSERLRILIHWIVNWLLSAGLWLVARTFQDSGAQLSTAL
jgi:hypothetical protein